MPSKILIVDDEPQIISVLQEYLESEGFIIESARDGVEGLEKYDSFKPDLMLLDLKMPHKTGYDVCREIYETRFCNVVIITGYPDELINIKKYIELGVSDCLVKPFDLNILLQKIKLYINKKIT